MLKKAVLSLVYVLISTVFTNSLQRSGAQTIQLFSTEPLLLSNFSDLLPSSNQSAISLNSTPINEVNIRCDGAKYGFNPDILDCQNAIKYFHPGRDRIMFGERGPSMAENVFPLPYRFMGGKKSGHLTGPTRATAQVPFG